MKYSGKRILILLILIIVTTSLDACRSKTPWNPYLSAKEKPSDKQRKEEKKQLEIGTKAYAEQMKKNKKEIQGNINKATRMKPKHKQITKHRHLKNSKRKG